MTTAQLVMFALTVLTSAGVSGLLLWALNGRTRRQDGTLKAAESREANATADSTMLDTATRAEAWCKERLDRQQTTLEGQTRRLEALEVERDAASRAKHDADALVVELNKQIDRLMAQESVNRSAIYKLTESNGVLTARLEELDATHGRLRQALRHELAAGLKEFAERFAATIEATSPDGGTPHVAA